MCSLFSPNPPQHREWAEIREIIAWSQMVDLTLRLSLLGLMLAGALGIFGYFFQSDNFVRFLYLGAAMGCLVASSVGINVSDRFRRKLRVPFWGAMVFLGSIIASLLWMFLQAQELTNAYPWPLLMAAGFSSSMCGVLWRLRASWRDLQHFEKEK